MSVRFQATVVPADSCRSGLSGCAAASRHSCRCMTWDPTMADRPIIQAGVPASKSGLLALMRILDPETMLRAGHSSRRMCSRKDRDSSSGTASPKRQAGLVRLQGTRCANRSCSLSGAGLCGDHQGMEGVCVQGAATSRCRYTAVRRTILQCLATRARSVSVVPGCRKAIRCINQRSLGGSLLPLLLHASEHPYPKGADPLPGRSVCLVAGSAGRSPESFSNAHARSDGMDVTASLRGRRAGSERRDGCERYRLATVGAGRDGAALWWIHAPDRQWSSLSGDR